MSMDRAVCGSGGRIDRSPGSRMTFDVVRDCRGGLLSVGDPTPNGEGYITELDHSSDLIAVMTPGGEQGFRSAQLELTWSDSPEQ
jgi:hypothetical protein